MLHGQHAHHDVLVEEVGRRVLVGADAADQPREVQHDVHLDVLKESLDVDFTSQVVVSTAHDDHLSAALVSQRLDDMAAEKASTAGDQDAASLQ